MANRLARETSPYLRQHAENPVDWYPWGDEAFAAARESGKPILLSVGYSACHWCHVMAHESFENPEIAALMNELFVSVKVDREERPDVDGIYMQAVQAMSGHGGWPMTVFLTPEGAPYFGGTYFPPEDRHGMRGFPTVLRAAAGVYHERRSDVDRAAAELTRVLQVPKLRPAGEPSPDQVRRAVTVLVESTDHELGGFGGAPKFPHPAAIDVLLGAWSRDGDSDAYKAASVTLDAMARGGIYDQLGGGFHRYSVDERWAVPHFEKMLYDNAQLVPVYLHAFQVSGRPRYRRVVEETLDYLVHEMRLSEGGFASSQDADSEGEEGRFFVWTPQQVSDALDDPDDAALACRIFGVTDAGNFEGGTTVLSLERHVEETAQLEDRDDVALRERFDRIRARLLEVRAQRVAPGRDGKVLTSWNALTLAAFAEAGAALGRADYVDVARGCADFLLERCVVDSVVQRTWGESGARITGFLEDVTFLADGLLTLHEATGEASYVVRALELAEDAVRRFRDPAVGFYDTASDAQPLLVRPRTLDDNPLPSGQSTAARLFLRLYGLTGEQRWRDLAGEIVAPLTSALERAPLAVANLLLVASTMAHGLREIAITGPRDDPVTRSLLDAVRSRFDPDRVLAWGGDGEAIPLLRGRGGVAAAHVCRDFVCALPVSDPERLRAQLEERD